MLQQAVGHSHHCLLNGYDKDLKAELKAYFPIPMICSSTDLLFSLSLDFIF
jgi:hypothetical protein